MSKQLYDMTPRELREEIRSAEARGDLSRALKCQQQLALLQKIGSAFNGGTE